MTERCICTGINNREDEWVSTENWSSPSLSGSTRYNLTSASIPVPDDNFAHALSVLGGFRLKLEQSPQTGMSRGREPSRQHARQSHCLCASFGKNAAILLFQQREVGCVISSGIRQTVPSPWASHGRGQAATIGQEIRMPQFKGLFRQAGCHLVTVSCAAANGALQRKMPIGQCLRQFLASWSPPIAPRCQSHGAVHILNQAK